MKRFLFYSLTSLVFIIFTLGMHSSPPSLAQDWQFREKPRGTLKVVHLSDPIPSIVKHVSATLVSLDENNNPIPGLAEDWRWIDDRTIEFKLTQGVKFHNGEAFNAETVRVNWEAYKGMDTPRHSRIEVIPDETTFEIIDEYEVRFAFPEPDGLALVKFQLFPLFAPAFFVEHKFEERGWG